MDVDIYVVSMGIDLQYWYQSCRVVFRIVSCKLRYTDNVWLCESICFNTISTAHYMRMVLIPDYKVTNAVFCVLSRFGLCEQI